MTSLDFRSGYTRPSSKPFLSEALGAPRSPQRTWEDDDFFRCFPRRAQPHLLPRPYGKKQWWAAPVFFFPRTPDFLLRLVALSNSMRLSLKESRTRGPVLCCVTANPGTLGRTWGTLCYSVRIGGGDYLRRNRPLHHPRLNLSLRPMCGKAVLPFVRGVPSAVPRLRGNKKSIFPSGAGTRPR